MSRCRQQHTPAGACGGGAAERGSGEAAEKRQKRRARGRRETAVRRTKMATVAPAKPAARGWAPNQTKRMTIAAGGERGQKTGRGGGTK